MEYGLNNFSDFIVIRVTIPYLFPGHAVFLRLKIYIWADFLYVQKCLGFQPAILK
jgi:hypothetical protein